MIELEKVFDDFCNAKEESEIILSDEINAKNRILNGEDNKTYMGSMKPLSGSQKCLCPSEARNRHC